MDIFVLTKNHIEDCDDAYVEVLAAGSFDDCKNAARKYWNKLAKKFDIGEFDEKEGIQWSCYVESDDDIRAFNLKLEIHSVKLKMPKG